MNLPPKLDNREQAFRMKRLFSSVVIAIMDDAVEECLKYGELYAYRSLKGWINSADGVEVLSNAGIVSSDRTTKNIMAYVENQYTQKKYSPKIPNLAIDNDINDKYI